MLDTSEYARSLAQAAGPQRYAQSPADWEAWHRNLLENRRHQEPETLPVLVYADAVQESGHSAVAGMIRAHVAYHPAVPMGISRQGRGMPDVAPAGHWLVKVYPHQEHSDWVEAWEQNRAQPELRNIWHSPLPRDQAISLVRTAVAEGAIPHESATAFLAQHAPTEKPSQHARLPDDDDDEAEPQQYARALAGVTRYAREDGPALARNVVESDRRETAPSLVYADWLQEHGHEGAADVVRRHIKEKGAGPHIRTLSGLMATAAALRPRVHVVPTREWKGLAPPYTVELHVPHMGDWGKMSAVYEVPNLSAEETHAWLGRMGETPGAGLWRSELERRDPVLRQKRSVGDDAAKYDRAAAGVHYARISAEESHPDYQPAGIAPRLGRALRALAAEGDGAIQPDHARLAESILRSGEHDHLPVLADALDEANHPAAGWYNWREAPRGIAVDKAVLPLIQQAARTAGRRLSLSGDGRRVHETASPEDLHFMGISFINGRLRRRQFEAVLGKMRQRFPDLAEAELRNSLDRHGHAANDRVWLRNELRRHQGTDDARRTPEQSEAILAQQSAQREDGVANRYEPKLTSPWHIQHARAGHATHYARVPNAEIHGDFKTADYPHRVAHALNEIAGEGDAVKASGRPQPDHALIAESILREGEPVQAAVLADALDEQQHPMAGLYNWRGLARGMEADQVVREHLRERVETLQHEYHEHPAVAAHLAARELTAGWASHHELQAELSGRGHSVEEVGRALSRGLEHAADARVEFEATVPGTPVLHGWQHEQQARRNIAMGLRSPRDERDQATRYAHSPADWEALHRHLEASSVGYNHDPTPVMVYADAVQEAGHDAVADVIRRHATTRTHPVDMLWNGNPDQNVPLGKWQIHAHEGQGFGMDVDEHENLTMLPDPPPHAVVTVLENSRDLTPGRGSQGRMQHQWSAEYPLHEATALVRQAIEQGAIPHDSASYFLRLHEMPDAQERPVKHAQSEKDWEAFHRTILQHHLMDSRDPTPALVYADAVQESGHSAVADVIRKYAERMGRVGMTSHGMHRIPSGWLVSADAYGPERGDGAPTPFMRVTVETPHLGEPYTSLLWHAKYPHAQGLALVRDAVAQGAVPYKETAELLQHHAPESSGESPMRKRRQPGELRAAMYARGLVKYAEGEAAKPPGEGAAKPPMTSREARLGQAIGGMEAFRQRATDPMAGINSLLRGRRSLPAAASEPEPEPVARNYVDMRSPQGVNFKVDAASYPHKHLETIFGKPVDLGHLADAAGVVEGAHVHFGVKAGGSQVGVRMFHPDHQGQGTKGSPLYEHQWTFSQVNNQPHAHLDLAHAAETPFESGFRGRFGDTLQRFHEMGIPEISMVAAGSKHSPLYKGYGVWPTYGGRGNINPDKYRELPAQFKTALQGSHEIQDLRALPGGPEWWRENGNAIDHLTFRTDPQSPERRHFDEYHARKTAEERGQA